MNLIHKIASTLIFFGIFSFTTAPLITLRVDAAIVNKTHDRTFTIQEDYVHVKETKTSRVTQSGFQITAGSKDGFTVFSPLDGDPDFAEKLQKTLDSVNVTSGSGAQLNYEINQTDSGNYEIVVVNLQNIPFGSTYTLILEYESYGLLINTGAIKDIFIPGFPENYSLENETFTESVSTQIRISNKFPEINFVSPEQAIKTSGDSRVVDIPINDLIGNSAWIQLGTEQFFEFEIKQTLPKTSNIPFAINSFSLPVPRDINSGPISQRVYYSQISPEPYQVKEDIDGNLIFLFKSSASQDLNINIKGYASLKQSQIFSFEDSGELADIPNDYQKYLEGANYWEVSDSDIQATAMNLRGDEQDIYTIITGTYEFVIDRIDYSFVKKNGLNDRQGALKTLNGGAAVCMEYSDLFITLLRAQGIPARAAFGYGYGTSDFEARQDNTINHQWAEVYIPRLDTWVAIDTTWGEFGSDLIGGDLNHFYSHVASIDPETPSTSSASFFGSLDEIPDRDMEIFMVKELPSENALDQTALLNKYPKLESFGEFISNLGIQNQITDDLIGDLLNTDSEVAINLFKVFVIVLICSPIILLIFFAIRNKRKNTKIINSIQDKELHT